MKKPTLEQGALSALAVALLLVALVAVNVVAGIVPLRLDITEGGLFTLSDGSKRILSALSEPVTIKYYFSEDVGETPIAVKNYHRKVSELLDEYEAASGGMLSVEKYNPKPDSDEEEWASRYGLTAVTLSQGGRLFFGLVVLSEEREAAMPFISPRRERFLEYDISEAISRVNQPERAKIGILSFLPITGAPVSRLQTPPPAWVVLQEMRKFYDLEIILPDATSLPEGLSAVLLIHPKRISDQLNYELDQFLMRGGRMMVLTDPNARLDQGTGSGMAFPGAGSSIKKFFDAWGVTHNKDKIIGDMNLATQVTTPQEGVVDFPLWITVGKQQMNQDLAITSDLEEVTLIDSGAFATTEDFKYKFIPLLTSTTESGEVDNIMARFGGPSELAKQVKPDGRSRVLAALIVGAFSTAYPDGAPPPDPKAKSGQAAAQPAKTPAPPKPHLAQAEQETTVAIIGDADFIGDAFSVQQVNFFGQTMVQPINDNLNFFLNTLEFIIGNQNLIEIRSRGQFSRPFTRVLALQAEAQRKYKMKEEALTKKLEEVQSQLDALEGKQGSEGGKIILTPSIVQEIQKFRREERRTRSALRTVRKGLRQDIEALGNRLLLLNLLVVPAIVALVGGFVIIRRSRRRGGRR